MHHKKRTINKFKKSSIRKKKLSPDNSEDKQDVHEFEMVRKQLESFDPRKWEEAIARKRQMSIFTHVSYEPRSTKGGQDWIEIPGSGKDSLPSIEYRSLVTHPDDGLTLFLAAKVGVFITRDEGSTWQVYSPDLPNVEVQQILWSGDYLYTVTHGRGLWRRFLCL